MLQFDLQLELYDSLNRKSYALYEFTSNPNRARIFLRVDQLDKPFSEYVVHFSKKSSSATTTMPAAMRNTVDRLDKPSAYYLGKVCILM